MSKFLTLVILLITLGSAGNLAAHNHWYHHNERPLNYHEHWHHAHHPWHDWYWYGNANVNWNAGYPGYYYDPNYYYFVNATPTIQYEYVAAPS